jgi:hypothetical protein
MGSQPAETSTSSMSKPNTNSGEREQPQCFLVIADYFCVAASTSLLDQGKKRESDAMKGWGSSEPTAQSRPPISKSTALPCSVGSQPREHATNATARSRYCSEWTGYGDLEPSGYSPWFA